MIVMKPNVLQLLKTPRNILIANIALSGNLLCLFTMPLAVMDMIHNYWPLGSGQVWQTKAFVKKLYLDLLFRKFCVKLTPPPRLRVSSSAPIQLSSSLLTGVKPVSNLKIINPLLSLTKSRQTLTFYAE